jgi:hypothetical protein
MLGGDIDAQGGTLEIGAGGGTNRSSGVILGPVRKHFANGTPAQAFTAAGMFLFPVGTGQGYFPAEVAPTAGSTGSITVQAFDGTAPATPTLDFSRTLQRYWSIAAVDVTADVKLFYFNSTAPGVEANYQLTRVAPDGAVTRMPNGTGCPATPGASPCVDTTVQGKTIFQSGVSSFNGLWTASEAVTATAAGVEVAGMVLNAYGRGIRGAQLTLTDASGGQMTTVTTGRGYYRFQGVETGSTYILTASSRRYIFVPMAVLITDNMNDLNIIALQ